MNATIYILIAIVLIFIFIVMLISSLKPKKYTFTPPDKYPYKRRDLFTRTEYAFYLELLKALKNNYFIYPKVRLEDLCEIIETENRAKYRGYVRSRHVDFLIADKKGKILIAIELDDPSHNTRIAEKTDDFKDKFFKSIELPLIRVKAGDNYASQIRHIQNALKRL